jgi:hypothetical protein
MSLGDHLRADEDVDFSAPHTLDHLFALRPAGHITVKAREARARESLLEERFDPLCSQPFLQKAGAAARCATLGKRRLVFAVVTLKARAADAVNCQSDRTMGAFNDGSAASADQTRGEAAAVQKEDGLAPFHQIFF